MSYPSTARTSLALLFLAGCAEGASTPDESRNPSTPNTPLLDSPASTETPDIDTSDAMDIAGGFVHAQVISGNRPEWSDAFVDTVTPYFDDQGRIQAYEAAVVAADKAPRGWLMVEAWNDFDPVSAYTTEGSTLLEQLLDRAEAVLGAELTEGALARPLWVGPSSVGLRVDTEDGAVLVGLSPESEHLSYDGDLRFATTDEMDEDPEDVTPASEQRDELRELYRSGGYDDDLMGAARTSVTGDPTVYNVAVGSGASSFSNFIQENRTWTNDAAGIYTCYTGCAPVAYGILIEYWDRNGYSSLVSSTSDNSNTSYTDSDVRWMLDELRWNLQTRCASSGGQASTSSSYFDNAVDHINSRGAGTWTSDNTSSSTKWSRLMAQISAGRPVVVHYDVDHAGGAIDHSAAGYEYTDNSGSSNDWICAEKGWYTSGTTWDCFTRTSVGTYHVTRVMPP